MMAVVGGGMLLLAAAAAAAWLMMCHLTEGSSVTIDVRNDCPFTIWPGILSNAGSAQLSITGFELRPFRQTRFQVPPNWSGRAWARTGCHWSGGGGGGSVCETGDCGARSGSPPQCAAGSGPAPPATLVELALAGGSGLDYYDVSVVDGYNLGVEVAPVGQPECSAARCAADAELLGRCPAALAELRRGGGGGGEVVACKSACVAFGEPAFCCAAAYASPAACSPSSYSRFFKSACPRAYTYAYDDPTATFTCPAASIYALTFCPSSSAANTTTSSASTSSASANPPYGDDYEQTASYRGTPTWWNAYSWNDNASNQNNHPILFILTTFVAIIFVMP